MEVLLKSIPLGGDGFFMERHAKLGPVETTTEGVFLAGCVSGPKDISDSIAQGAADEPRLRGRSELGGCAEARGGRVSRLGRFPPGGLGDSRGDASRRRRSTPRVLVATGLGSLP